MNAPRRLQPAAVPPSTTRDIFRSLCLCFPASRDPTIENDPPTCTVSWMVPRLKTAVVVKCWWDQSDLLVCTRFAPVELEQSISPRCHSQVAACSPGLHSRLNLSQVRSGELAVKSFEDLWVTRAQSLLIAELQQIGFEAPRHPSRGSKGAVWDRLHKMAALAGDHF